MALNSKFTFLIIPVFLRNMYVDLYWYITKLEDIYGILLLRAIASFVQIAVLF